MAEYIDREALSETIDELLLSPYASDHDPWGNGVRHALTLIKDIINDKVRDSMKVLAADVHGEWLQVIRENIHGEEYRLTRCSVCGYEMNNNFFFEPWEMKHCPNCGTRMGEQDG